MDLVRLLTMITCIAMVLSAPPVRTDPPTGSPTTSAPTASTAAPTPPPTTTAAPTPPPVANPIILTTHPNIDIWWVGFMLRDQDLSCGGAITNVEITDHYNYNGQWKPFKITSWNDFQECHFDSNAIAYTPPLSVRITRTHNSNTEVITAVDLITPISLGSGNTEFNFGTNFCIPTDSPTGFPTVSPIASSPTNPTSHPSSNPANPPSTSPPTQYPSSFPSTMPSANPTKTPTNNPSNVPTLIPSLTPTDTPSNKPSLSPSKAPSRSPTPKPTVPSLLNCGQQVIGDYNDQILEFNVRVPYAGDLVFDASSSSIAIQSLTAVFGVTPIGADTDNDGILTVSVAIPADYTFTLRAPNGVYGTFDVRVSCQSDQPTRSPSKYPTAKPTALPTKAPTKRPTDAPIKPGSPTRSPTRPSLTPTMNPAFTASPSRFPSTVPSVFPTSFPTKIPSNNPTKTPTRTPTQVPSKIPTKTPTVTPTETPSDNPTHVPSLGPTKKLREGEVFVSTRGAEITKSSEDDGHDSWEDDAQTDDAFLTIAAVLVGCIILVLIFAICWRLKLIKFTPSPEAYKIEMDSKTMGTKRRVSRVGSVSHVSEERKEYVDDPEDTVDVETQDADDKPGMDQETDDISVDMETQGMDEEQKAVKDWLIGFKMERYYDLLMENGMTSLEYIERIETTQDLYHIGVMLKGHQIVIMSEITKLIMTETPGDVDVDLIFNGEAAGGGEGECTTGFETAGNIKND